MLILQKLFFLIRELIVTSSLSLSFREELACDQVYPAEIIQPSNLTEGS